MTTEPTPIDEDTWATLVAAATEAYQRAYAPYSRFSVGAAVRTADGRTFVGCNVENASYGLTICAERSALFNAVSGSPTGRPDIVAVAIASSPATAASPCGACRQVLMELAPDAVVSFEGTAGREEMTVRELLPKGFEFDKV